MDEIGIFDEIVHMHAKLAVAVAETDDAASYLSDIAPIWRESFRYLFIRCHRIDLPSSCSSQQ